MRIKDFAIFLVAVILTAAMAGCRTKKAVETVQPQQWTSFTAPLKVQLETPKKVSVSGRCTMIRNKSILFSVRMLGMEVGSAYVTPDSVYVVDKVHKYILGESLVSVLNGNYIEFADLQELLMGNADAAPWIADAIDYSAVADEAAETLTVRAAVDLGAFVSGNLTWNMGASQRDMANPQQWKRPEGYTVIPPSSVAKILKQF